MFRDLDRICERYEWQLRNGSVSRARHGSIELQVARFRAAQERSRHLLASTRELLLAQGVPTRDFPFYYACVLRLDRLARNYSGKTLCQLLEIELDRWTARGLDQPVLSALPGLVLPPLEQPA